MKQKAVTAIGLIILIALAVGIAPTVNLLGGNGNDGGEGSVELPGIDPDEFPDANPDDRYDHS